MKILVLADVESKYLWDYFEKEKLDGIDLILSCGDLRSEYLSFLASFAKVPILYVRGNHDDNYAFKEPEGCVCIEDKIYVSVLWGLEVLSDIRREPTSIHRVR